MSMPKTMIVGVFLHGTLHIKNNGEVNTINVPDGMHVTVINAVAPGVPNISTLQEYENIATKISTFVKTKKRKYNKLTKPQIETLSVHVKNMLVSENKNQATDIIKEHQYLYSKKDVNPNFQKYTYQYGNAFQIKAYNTNDTIPNKLFIRFSEKELVNPDNIKETYFNNIVLYNYDELYLFNMLLSVGLDINQITLEQMLEFFIVLGVENVIMIDMSCSVFNSTPEFLTERNIRQTRRQMLFG